MLIHLTFKDPDGVFDSVSAAVHESLLLVEGLSEKEIDSLQEERFDSTMEWVAQNWCRWGEYLDVTIDTETNTAIVHPLKSNEAK